MCANRETNDDTHNHRGHHHRSYRTRTTTLPKNTQAHLATSVSTTTYNNNVTTVSCDVQKNRELLRYPPPCPDGIGPGVKKGAGSSGKKGKGKSGGGGKNKKGTSVLCLVRGEGFAAERRVRVLVRCLLCCCAVLRWGAGGIDGGTFMHKERGVYARLQADYLSPSPRPTPCFWLICTHLFLDVGSASVPPASCPRLGAPPALPTNPP